MYVYVCMCVCVLEPGEGFRRGEKPRQEVRWEWKLLLGFSSTTWAWLRVGLQTLAWGLDVAL